MPDPSRERLRFSKFNFHRSSDGRCTATVALDLQDGTEVSGSSTGLSSEMLDLRVAAEATLRALESFTSGTFGFELIGVKTVRAFDANVIIVSVAAKRGPSPSRLLGSCLLQCDAVRGAA